MVTRKRVDFVRRAVLCFQNQSYPNRELIVVHDDYDGTREYLDTLGDDRIRYLHTGQADLTLGELRNFGIAEARGEYIAQWDDDDWHHPDRLLVQCQALEQAEADLCLLERWILAWPERRQFMWSKRRPWEGTLLARRVSLPAYLPLGRGEDSALLDECRDRQLKICLLDRPDLYIYTVHGGNTYPVEHFQCHIFNDSTGDLASEDTTEVLKNLRQGLTAEAITRLSLEPPRPSCPSVCVLIPVYNQARYLYRAIASVIWQLGPQDELIVVDDASTDRIAHCGLEPFRKKILWLTNSTRQGVSFSRNRGIHASNADWIKFLDADDILAPFALDVVRGLSTAIATEAKVVSGGCHRISNSRYVDYICGNDENMRWIHDNNPTLPSAAFVRRETLLDVGLFDVRMDENEDWDLWLRIHEKFGSGAFYFVQQPLCYYWIDDEERRAKHRHSTVDGLPVLDYLTQRYRPKEPE